ncbi:major facilitator superfamily domain-containing protein [Pelagophyceae sp. CCMP2097]|nr:major facilitator superfamily domain-containing protein [Pelagophyceae sp. CCMP2097]
MPACRAALLFALACAPARGFNGPRGVDAFNGPRAPVDALQPRGPRRGGRAAAPTALAPTSDAPRRWKAGGDRLPRALVPIWLGVFCQMLGEGVAISSLPLHMRSFGASPWQTGVATSCFSAAQMICCPLLVKSSAKVGSRKVLRVCLAGAAVSNVVIACSASSRGVLVGRCLAGAFAASVPVAQAASAELVGPHQTGAALARVSASAQLGVVVGPALVAILAWAFEQVGVPRHLTTRCVFGASAAFAAAILALGSNAAPAAPMAALPATDQVAADGVASASASAAGTASAPASPAAATPALLLRSRLAQPLLRLIALSLGWSLTLSVATYCLFGAHRLGYAQPQLSATFSAGAAVTVAAQLWLVPELLRGIGDHAACSTGLAAVGIGLAGCSMVATQPFHLLFYLLNRVGSGVGDTATATLVAANSPTKQARAENLGLIQSTRAAARIVTPVLGGKLFEMSCYPGWPAQGALPYLCAASLCLVLSPLPLFLRARTETPASLNEEAPSICRYRRRKKWRV